MWSLSTNIYMKVYSWPQLSPVRAEADKQVTKSPKMPHKVKIKASLKKKYSISNTKHNGKNNDYFSNSSNNSPFSIVWTNS